MDWYVRKGENYMKISTRGRYAIRLMIDIAENSKGDNISLKEISNRQGISLKYLEQIIGQLCKDGLLSSSRGAKGGYKLSKNVEDYKLGEILRSSEGDLSVISCLEGNVNECPRSERCETLNFWKGLDDKINNYVDSFTLKDMISQGEPKTLNCIE